MTAAPAGFEIPEVLQQALTSPAGRALIRAVDERVRCERSFSAFVRHAWPVIEPGTPYLHNWHIDLIAEHLMAVDSGEIKRLIINMPPRHAKSILVTVMWPVWSWIANPATRWQFWSYSADLMTKHSLDRRAIVESDWYQAHWGHRVHLKADENRKQLFMNTERGVMDATRTKTGKGGNRLVIDDPVDPEDALSETTRRTANRIYDLTLSSRLDNPAEDAIVIVMQRLHEDDLTGHVEEQGFTKLAIPSIAEEQTVHAFPVSGRTVEREQGELLWPERFPPHVIEQTKVALGAYGFSSQHQQRPVPLGGAIFSAARWGRYRREELPERFGRVIVTADTAHEAGQENDFSVLALWAEGRQGWYLLDLFKKQMEYPELEQVSLELWQRWRGLPPGWRPHRLIIENKASGITLRQRLAKETRIPIEPFNPGTKDKVARAHSISGYQASGRLYLPEREEDAVGPIDTGAFIAEHALFPNARHDDQVDTTTMAILWFTDDENNAGGEGIVATGSAKGRW
jgi:predicted phage terminase large subunit-like protein